MTKRTHVDELDPGSGADGDGIIIDGGKFVVGPLPSGGAGAGAFVGCKARRTTALSVPGTGAFVAVPFDASEDYDTDTIHDLTTNPSRFTVPTGMAGVWRFTATFLWASSSSATARSMLFYVNGAALPQIDGGQRVIAPASLVAYQSSTVDLELVAGDYVEVQASHGSGSAVNLTSAVMSAQFMAATGGGGGAGATTVDDLTDVDTTTTAPTDGQALVWDATTSTWVPGTVAGGGGAAHEDQALTVAGADAKLATERRWGFGLPALSTPVLVLEDDGTHFPVNDGVDYLSMFNAAAVLTTPLDTWYAYAASHDDTDIWLLTAPDPLGPWTWQQVVMSTTLSPLLQNHVSSPHVIVRNGTIILTYHGHDASMKQPTVLATSTDGVTFTEQGSVTFPLATNALRFYSESTSYVRIVDAGYALVAVFQANRAENNLQLTAKTTTVGWAVAKPTDPLTWKINRKPLLSHQPGGVGPFSPALIRLHGQWLILAMDWEANTIYGYVSDRLEPGSFVSVGALVTSIPAGMTRVYHPEAILHDGKLIILFTADTGTSSGGKIYATTVDWGGIS